MRRALFGLILAASVAAVAAPACKRTSDDGTSPRGQALPALELRDDTANLLLTYLDEKGDFFTAQRVDEVPIDRRDAVRVVVTTRDEGAVTELVYVANLSQKKPDGTYPVNTMTRAEWEGIADARRKGRAVAAAPTPADGRPARPAEPGDPRPRPPTPAPDPGVAPAAPVAGKVTVHVYGASWCGPCHQAQAHLHRRGVAVVYHDVESEPGAQQEMARKLARAGVRGGSIPVIDVAGTVLVGFDPRALDAAVAQAAKRGTPL
jgi:glutaredoxin